MSRTARTGLWNRRTLLSTALGAAIAAPLSACGSAAGNSRDRIRVGFPTAGSAESLDPHTSSMFVDQARAKALFDTLAGYDDDMSLVPRLAESWESDEKGRRWRIRLRRARFHDGDPVTASDVLYSYRRIADADTDSPARSAFVDVDFGASRARSERELELVLNHPNFAFPAAWGGPATEIIPEGTTKFSKPVGSGPFRFHSFEQNSSALFTAFDGYWDGDNAPDELEFVAIDDESARVNALLSGQIHYAEDVTANSATRLRRDQRTKVLAAEAAAMQEVALSVDRRPFSDKRVMQAVQYGIDREQLVDVALAGQGKPGNDLFGKGLEYYPSNLSQRHRDVDRARSLLAEAGESKPSFTLDTGTADPYFQRAAKLIAEQLEEIGMDVTTRNLPEETYYSEIREKSVAAHVRTATLPITTFLSERMLSGEANSGYTGYESSEFDSTFRKALHTADDADRAELLTEAQQLVREDSGMVAWGFSNYNAGISSSLNGVAQAPPNSLQWARFDHARLG